MRNLIIAFAVASFTFGGAACAYNPLPLAVYASRADWEILAGHWQGTYTTSSSGRRGVVEFTLSAGDEQAFGDVLMFADGEPGISPVSAWLSAVGPNQRALRSTAHHSVCPRGTRADQGDYRVVLGSGSSLPGVGDVSRRSKAARDRWYVHVHL